jgi:hypothetical protein
MRLLAAHGCPPPCPAVYLDIINLFLHILRLLGEQQRNN